MILFGSFAFSLVLASFQFPDLGQLTNSQASDQTSPNLTSTGLKNVVAVSSGPYGIYAAMYSGEIYNIKALNSAPELVFKFKETINEMVDTQSALHVLTGGSKVHMCIHPCTSTSEWKTLKNVHFDVQHLMAFGNVLAVKGRNQIAIQNMEKYDSFSDWKYDNINDLHVLPDNPSISAAVSDRNELIVNNRYGPLILGANFQSVRLSKEYLYAWNGTHLHKCKMPCNGPENLIPYAIGKDVIYASLNGTLFATSKRAELVHIKE